MRLAFWRAGTAKALVEKVLAVPAPAVARQVADLPSGDLDLRALGQVLMRKRGLIVVPTMLAAVIAIMAVNLVTPRYKSEARILIDGRENVFLRPNGERNEERTARDPELAARVANSIADGYLVLQQSARQDQAKSASQWLSREIENLRNKVSDAESRAEDFRSRSSLFIGTNNTSLSNQQMGELNTQLNNARALKSDAETKARLIREMLQSCKPIEASEVLNSELMRRLSDHRVTLRAQLAEQSSTLLDNR